MTERSQLARALRRIADAGAGAEGCEILEEAASFIQDRVRSHKPFVPDILEDAANTYRERNALYGDNYNRAFGQIMNALFPRGYTAESPEDWNRLGLLVQIVGKLTRFAPSIDTPHLDSIHDLMVYSAMLEEICTPPVDIRVAPKEGS